METRTGRLRARWLVLVLGGILLVTTVLFGPVTNAGAQGQGKAQGQSQAKGKAQGQVQGQVQGADVAEGGDEGEGGGGQEKVTLCHKGTNTITVGLPAVQAHLDHHDDQLGECGDAGGTPPPPTDGGLVGLVGTITDTDDNNSLDLLSFPATGCTVAQDATLTITQNGQSTTFTNGDNATITPGAAALEVEGVPAGSDLGLLADQPITIASSTGIECTNVTLTGTLATTRSGDVALRTTDGKGGSKAVPLVTQTQDQEKRLEKLATSKLGKVKVTGVKVKDKSAKKGTKAKAQERKEALKVTSVKETNKK